MTSFVFLGLLFFSFQNGYLSDEATCQQPKVDGSYMAMGEMTEKIEDDFVVQARFDETFDVETGNAAFTVHEIGMNTTYIEVASANQTYRYVDKECNVVTSEDWIAVEAPPSLIGYTGDKGKVKFSLRQLFALSDKFVVKDQAGKKEFYRGIPSVSWLYQLDSPPIAGNKTQVIVYAYWSDESWHSTSRFGQQIPLGYTITKTIHDEYNRKILHVEQFVNVFGFVHDAVDAKAFEAKEGIFCQGRNKTIAFPKLSIAKTMTFRSELVLPDYQEIKTMDVWYDAKNGFLRVDLDRFDTQDPTSKTRRYTSQITSQKLGVVFSFDVFKSSVTCKPIPLQQYKMDMQEIVNPKLDLKFWGFDYLLGRNSSDFVYIGKASKRNIPCHVFQGYRYDWPDMDAGVVSLWEWCVAAKLGNDKKNITFRDGEIGLVSAQIWVNSSLDPNYKGYRMFHHLYDVLEENPANLDVATFDISRCFNFQQRRSLEFVVDFDINKENIVAVENATSDVNFLMLWKNVIIQKSKLTPESLRITRVQSMIFDKKLYVNFLLLGIHPNLSEDIKNKQPSSEDAFNSLKDAVDNNQLEIRYKLEKTLIPLKAVKGTLNDVAKQITFSTPAPTSPEIIETTTGPLIPFTLIPPDITTGKQDSSSSGQTDQTSGPQPTGTPKPLREVFEGHYPGTVAGVSIAMLICGFTIGAGGTFYKIRGMSRY